jgi:hypothetical protein
MSYLYKRSNWLWWFLIRTRLTHAAWSPIVEWTRRRHLRFRAKLQAERPGGDACAPPRRTLMGLRHPV